MSRSPSGLASGGEQPILLEIERDGPHSAQRLVVDIGQPGIDLEILEHREDLDRGARQDGEFHLGMPGPIGRGEGRHHRQRRRDRGDLQAARQTMLQGAQFLAHGAAVGHDGARPVEHALALGREADEARLAMDQQDAQRRLELLDAGRERRLRNAAQFGRPAEIPFARQGNQELELVDHVELYHAACSNGATLTVLRTAAKIVPKSITRHQDHALPSSKED